MISQIEIVKNQNKPNQLNIFETQQFLHGVFYMEKNPQTQNSIILTFAWKKIIKYSNKSILLKSFNKCLE